MRYKVELHPSVVWFVRHQCSETEVDAFYERVEALRTEAIRNSEAVFEPSVSRYKLRMFRFGVNIAVFEYDPGRGRIRVLECRKTRPPRGRKKGSGDAGRP